MADVRQIPLRLNKRRDGSVVLTNHLGIGDAADREFPPEHVFGYEWLATGGAELARLEGDQVVLTLGNGTATYEITERGPGGVRGRLVDSALSDAPPIDDERAASIRATPDGAPRETRAERMVAKAGSVHIEVPNESEEG